MKKESPANAGLNLILNQIEISVFSGLDAELVLY